MGDGGARPWLTVVVPTRNRPALVSESVESALCADAGAYVVVVDDASEQQQREMLDALRSDRVVVVDGHGRGPSSARNLGAASATTPWLLFLDDDDLLDREGLDRVRSAIEETPALGLVFAGVAFTTSRHGERDLRPPADLGPAFHSVEGNLLAGSFCVDRGVFDAVGGYEETLHYAENTELVLRLVDHCDRHQRGVASVDGCLSIIWRRPPSSRPSYNSAATLHGSRYLLEIHAQRFSVDPVASASLHRVAGVSCARLRDTAGARAHFEGALAASGSLTDRLRLIVVRTPGLRNLVWR
jgi:glycosyltransferase involved in cell wall biosynthesis